MDMIIEFMPLDVIISLSAVQATWQKGKMVLKYSKSADVQKGSKWPSVADLAQTLIRTGFEVAGLPVFMANGESQKRLKREVSGLGSANPCYDWLKKGEGSK